MNAGSPMGFLLVVGSAVVLLAALQILHLAYTVDAARSVRRLVELEEMKVQPNPVLWPATLSPEDEEEFRKALAQVRGRGSLNTSKNLAAAPTTTGPA